MDLEAVKSHAGRLLAPVPGAAPEGQNASLDPRYESLRNTMAALDSPTGGAIEWPTVVASGESLLQSTSKDLLVAAYTTFALLQTNGLGGLATGLQAILGLFDQYWDTMFPPAARLRGRGNALDWLVARLEVTLAQHPFQPNDRALVDFIAGQWKELGTKGRDRLGEMCPSMRGVDEVLQRVQMKLPPVAAAGPAEPAMVSESAAGAASASASASASEPASAPASEPASASASASASAPATDAAPAAAPAPAPAPAPAKVDPLAELQAKAEPWLQPIRADAPSGTDARFDPEYEEARVEIAKLDAVTAGPPIWMTVLARTDNILKTKAKDVLMASYFAFARYKEKGLAELPLGLIVLDGVIDKFWDDVFPTRPRGRGNAAGWLTEQLSRALAEEKLQPKHRPAVLALEIAMKQLANTIRDRMADDGPGTRELLERVQRMLLAVPEPKVEPPKPATPPPSATATPTAAPRPAAPAVQMQAVGDVSNPAEVEKFLLETGRALVKAAGMLRAAGVTNPAAYRLMRAGLWLHLNAPPPADASGKTQIPALPAPRKQQLETMLANKLYPALIEETEGSLATQRFNLDLQRMSWAALDGLGDGANAAKVALAAEVRSLLTRLPQLLDYTAADGSPLASADTKSWLAEHVLAGGSGGGGGGGGADTAGDADAMQAAKGAMKDKPVDAMKLARKAIEGAASPRSRFIRQLILAEICLAAGQTLLARGMFAGLERELRERGLLQWESDLAGRCLEGLVRAIRAAAKTGHKFEGADEVFERLCMIDPGAAARVAG